MTILNRNTTAKKISFDWKNENVNDSLSKRDAKFSTTTYGLKDLWAKKDAGTTQTTLAAEIPGHDVLMLRLTSGAAPSTPAQKPIRIKAGADAPFTDADGNVWLPDQGFADGQTEQRDASLAVANTKDPALYRTEHWGMTAFTYPVPNGKYTVKLHFAETYDALDTAGSRVFSYNVAGHEFKDFDVFAKSGGMAHACVETVPVDITNGKLDITFTAGVENPEINGIEIIPAP
jgi:hypothetical protein